MLLTFSLFTNAQHKGQFVEYENAFYGKIKESLNKKKPSKKRKLFKLDPTGIDAPKSIDDFETVWCQNPLSQGRTGTCWCFATSSFYESEAFRISKKEVKLSEIHTVYWEYVEKAREYVKTRGASYFGEGSETNAVARMMKTYGMVPQSAYAGINPDLEYHDHAGMFNEMRKYLESCKNMGAWNEEIILSTIKSTLNHYLGTPPTKFDYEGKSYTPKTFMSDYLKINPDDYVNFMSLMEKPYYTKAEYDVPDNWWNSDDYNNVPLDDFLSAIASSIDKGYSVSIGGDVSESGYLSNHDLAVVPTYDIPSEYIDENARQLRFSNGSTTDDHAIHIIGKTKKGKDNWYLIKDSGSGSRNGKNEGYYFYHEDYIKLKIMTFTIHKDAVEEILNKMK